MQGSLQEALEWCLSNVYSLYEEHKGERLHPSCFMLDKDTSEHNAVAATLMRRALDSGELLLNAVHGSSDTGTSQAWSDLLRDADAFAQQHRNLPTDAAVSLSASDLLSSSSPAVSQPAEFQSSHPVTASWPDAPASVHYAERYVDSWEQRSYWQRKAQLGDRAALEKFQGHQQLEAPDPAAFQLVRVALQ